MQEYKKIEKVCFLGSHQVGKTNLFNRLCGQVYFKPYQSTLKSNFHTRFYAQGPLQYWDFPSEEARYRLGQQQQVVLVFNRSDRRSLVNLQGYLALIQKHAPKAIVTVVGITDAFKSDDFLEEAIDAFLERNHIDFEHYLPILTSSPASIHTLSEHLQAIKQPQGSITPDQSDTPTSSVEQSRVSPTSVANRLYRFIGSISYADKTAIQKGQSISSPNLSIHNNFK